MKRLFTLVGQSCLCHLSRISKLNLLRLPLLLTCLATSVLIAVAQQITPSGPVKNQYNVLLIMVDDMNTRHSFLGYPEVITPNIQRLVNRGMVFNQAFCQFPLCNPSRTSLLTGWRPDKTQVFTNDVRPTSLLDTDVIFLPEYFKQNGYTTERYGKIMHGYYEDDISWDYAEPKEKSHIESMNRTLTIPAPGKWWIVNDLDTIFPESKYAMHLASKLQQTQSAPFFYCLGLSVHSPFTPNVDHWNIYGDPSVQELLPVNRTGKTDTIKGNGSANIDLPLTPTDDRLDVPSVAFTYEIVQNDSDWKKTIHAYYAEVSLIDTQIGYVLDELDRQNLWSNTIVVFISDHGQHLGEHNGLWLKQTLFKESIEVPMIVCVPGKAPGVCSGLTELVDLYPTLTELCGFPKLPGLEGYSFVKLLDNPGKAWKRAVFSQVQRQNEGIMGRSVRTQQYHYNSWETYGEELYDIIADPNEYNNLATFPAYANILYEMRNILAEGWSNSLPEKCKEKTFYRDADKDGFGNPADTISVCFQPNGYVTDNTDCNDTNILINPAATELCNNKIDDNCNGLIDESNLSAVITASGSTDICSTGAVTLYTTKVAGYRYQWRKDNHNIPGARKWKYTATTPGTYRVGIMDSSSCTVLSKSIRVTAENCITARAGLSGIDLKNTASMPGVFPNPSTGLVTLRFNSIINGPAQIRVTDMAGKSINASTITVTKGVNTHQLNLSQLANGVYFIEAQSGNEHCRFTCIIAK